MVTKDGGDTWEHRNRGLSTAQVARFAQHPQYASVILCGMQDLGGAFGNGAPVWKVRHWDDGPFESMQGDGVLAAIPPHEPHRRFYGYQDHALRRSDDGGRNFKIKQSVAGYWFYPLAFDPGTAGVCYFGSNTLQRSEDYLDNFQFATAALGSAFSTIAVHPGDPNQVVVGTVEGAVWRVQRTGPSWFVADVTATDLAAPPLPPGRCVSCVAIEAGGAIWVSFSSIFLTEDEKEFDSGAVFRLAADASTWEDRSQGLPEADPVNALAIDPASGAVFCGADRGVFRWDSASEAWLLWDHGLPNAPVFDLAVHAASKTLRAATYGRGVWERPIALPSVPDVDVYIRGNVAHGGKGPPPSGEPDPFYPDDLVWWWQSADVKVDSHQLETEALTDDPVAFAAKISYENVRRGKLNRFYVQTHNRGPFTATKVRVRAFLADASLGLPNLPADFWAAGGPFDKAPSGTDWTAVGPTYEVGDLQPGTSGVAGWEVVVAQSTAEHTCLLALVTCDEDPLDAGGVLVIEQLVNGHNNAALRNLVVTSD
jgi:hypothetical protein